MMFYVRSYQTLPTSYIPIIICLLPTLRSLIYLLFLHFFTLSSTRLLERSTHSQRNERMTQGTQQRSNAGHAATQGTQETQQRRGRRVGGIFNNTQQVSLIMYAPPHTTFPYDQPLHHNTTYMLTSSTPRYSTFKHQHSNPQQHHKFKDYLHITIESSTNAYPRRE